MSIQKIIHRLINLGIVKVFLTKNRFLVKRYFNFLYSKNDPYQSCSGKVAERFNHSFMLLGNHRFRRGLEIGCGEGWNTWRLAEICDYVDAVDISDIAIKKAWRVNNRTNINFEVFDIVTDQFRRSYDFIFCSEVLYYLHLNQLDRTIKKIISALQFKGVIKLLHSRSLKDDDAGLTLKEFGAKTIHELFLKHESLNMIYDETASLYRVTILEKAN